MNSAVGPVPLADLANLIRTANHSSRAVQGLLGQDVGEKMGVAGLSGAASAIAKFTERMELASIATKAYYTTNWRGVEEKERADKLMKKYGFDASVSNVFATGPFGTRFTERGMTPEAQVKFALSQGEGGLKTIRGKTENRLQIARSIAIAGLVKKGTKPEDVTEQMVSQDSQYAKLKDFAAIIDKLIMVFKSDLNINVRTVMGGSPGDRVKTNSQPTPGASNEGVLGLYILGS